MAFVDQALLDDVLSASEENLLLGLAGAMGYSQAQLEKDFPDLMPRLIIARINDGRMPVLNSPLMITKPGEVVHVETDAALLKEVVHREFRGGSSGVSVPVGFGVRVRSGGFRGRSVVTGTSLEPADTGVLSVTSTRVVFAGQKKTQESRLDRLVSLEGFSDGIRIGVSNRQTASLYRVSNGPVVAAAISGALSKM